MDFDRVAGTTPEKMQALRIKMSREFRPEPMQRTALADLTKKLLMIFNAHAPTDRDHGDPHWACYLKADVRPVVRSIGESAYRLGGMQGMYFVCDFLNTVQVKTLGIQNHTCIRELNLVWHGIGNTKGEPVADYWLS